VDSIEPYFDETTHLPASAPIRFQFDTPLPDEVTLSISKEVFGEVILSETVPASDFIDWSRRSHPANTPWTFAPNGSKATYKHGSWLNTAEIELSVLHRQCLKARIPDQATLIEKVAAWEKKRNASEATVRWRFTTKDARIKLHSLYLLILLRLLRY
jgi:hypothetical protein